MSSYRKRQRVLLAKRFPRDAAILLSGLAAVSLSVIVAPTFVDHLSGKADIAVYRLKNCRCVGEWIVRLKEEGFSVSIHQPMYVSAVRKRLGVPEEFKSCHTSIAGQYFIEGHVPMDSVQQLLRTTPDIAGIFMPDRDISEYFGVHGEGRNKDVMAVSDNGELISFTDLTLISESKARAAEDVD